MKKMNAKMIVTLALLVALHIILSRFLSVNAWNIKIGFAFAAIFIAAYLYGPVAGALTGALGDLLGAILFPIGPYFPGFTLTCALTGLLYGFLLHKKQTWPRILTAACVNNLIFSLLINSYWIMVVYGTPFTALVATRSVQVAILIPVEIIVMRLLSEMMGRINARRLAGVDVQSEIMEKRRIIRNEKKALREAIPEDERREKSIAICERIMELNEFKDAKTVLLYSAVRGEVDVSFIKGRKAAYPVIIDKERMEAYIPEENSEFAVNMYNIPEPDKEKAELVLPENIDLVISPCTAFDEKMGRLGMGGGYYDRYLEKCTGAKVVCAAYECQKTEDVYMMKWDRYADIIVTENNTYIAK